MKRFFLSGLTALCFALTPASAQDGAHTHPAYETQDTAQDDAIASLITRLDANDAATAAADQKAEAAIIKNSAQDGALDAINQGIAAVNAKIDRIEVETTALRQSLDVLDGRVLALEAAGPPPDTAPLPVISVDLAPLSAVEGSAFTVTLSRTGDLTGGSSVAYAASGEADAADFVGGVIASGVVSFAAGEALSAFPVATNDDAIIEADESFDIGLSNPVGADIGVGFASAVILNNDAVVPPPPPPPPPPTPGPTGSVWPDGADGKPIVVFVPGAHREFQGENPYKNTLLLADFAPAAKLIDGTADQKTGWICLAPNEVIPLGFVRPNNEDGANPDPGLWVISAEIKAGSAATIDAPLFVTAGSSSSVVRKTRTYGAADRGNDQVVLNGNAGGGCIRSKFAGPEKYENDNPFDFRPEFVRDASRYHIVRMLNYTTTSGSRVTNDAEWLDDDDAITYSGTNCFKSSCYINKTWPTVGPVLRAGYKIGQIFKLSREADVAAWINVPGALGGESVKPELISCKGATLIPAIAANWSAIEPAMKREARAFAKRVARSAVANSYPDDKVLIIEPVNEVWNHGNSAFACSADYASGIGLAFSGAANNGVGLGVTTAIYVDAFKEVFAQEKPQQALSFAVGMQTAAFSNFTGNFHGGFVSGFKQYVAANPAIKAELTDVFAATTGYFSGGASWNKNRSPGAGNNPFGVSDEASFNAAFIAADADGSLFGKMRAYYLGPWSTNTNRARLVDLHTKWRDWAVANGLRGVIEYEGSPADVVGTAATNLGAVYPQAAATLKRWAKTQQAFDVQDAIIIDISAIKPMNPAVTSGWIPQSMPVSNFQSTGNQSLSAPWNERDFMENGICPTAGFAGAWCKHLRQPVQ